MKKLAFVFPGQGSQKLGMLADVAQQYPIVQETFAEASRALDFNLWSLVQNGPESELNKTEFTQPALLTASVALWRIWVASNKPLPRILAGHSLGEYSALVCAGALKFTDAVKLVHQRGCFMQAAVPPGAGGMAAIIGLTDETVVEICQQITPTGSVAPANFNSPGQIVISGARAAVEKAADLAKQQGARKVVMLPVSVPSHCILMQPAAKKLASTLTDIHLSAPTLAVLNNVDVASVQTPVKIKDVLVRQLTQPVQWVETVQKMATEGVTSIIECGPGKVLTGLNKRIDKNLTYTAIGDAVSLEKLLQETV